MSKTRFYTWVDVQDKLYESLQQGDGFDWLQYVNFRAYWNGLTITYSNNFNLNKNPEDFILEELQKIFLARLELEKKESFIILEGNRKFPIYFDCVEPDEIETLTITPSLSRHSFIGFRKIIPINRVQNANPYFFAFHSFKGGVGRTLHAAALAIFLSETHKVLLIDADFEAPGISWLVDQSNISFSDFLALIHGNDRKEVVEITSNALKNNELDGNKNLFIMPAFRGLREGNVPVLEIKPEHIFKFSEEPFLLTDILKELAIKLEIDYVIIDLRAGVSELSSSWFFDPLIKKVFVTTLSSQSLMGTSKMFEVLAKFKQENEIKSNDLPFLIISQIPKESVESEESKWGDIYSSGLLLPLREAYQKAFINLLEYENSDQYENFTNEQIIGNILSTLTFFSVENESLKSLPDTWDTLSKLIIHNNLHEDISKTFALATPYINENIENEDFQNSRKTIKKIAHDLIFAETNIINDFLITKSIKNLMSDYRKEVPVVVIVGAKGSGKTFLFQQIKYASNWNDFLKHEYSDTDNNADIIPVTKPLNSISDSEREESHQIWLEYIKPDIEKKLNESLTNSEWREKWLNYIAWADNFEIGKGRQEGREYLNKLKTENRKIVAIFDGLEDLFKQFNTDTKQQKAIESLLQDVPNWLESQPERRIGLIVFVRKDLVSTSITQNSSQFLSKHQKYELKWDSEEALRLVHWIINKFSIFSHKTFNDWERSLQDKSFNDLILPLYKLWGMRMASDNSKEAYSYNWILGSLANLKKEVQSRDIVRFLDFAASKSLEINDDKITRLYKDRAFYPQAIRQSIDEVGREKIEEVKKENAPLKKVLEQLENKTREIKFPCKLEEIQNILNMKDIDILIDNGVMILYNGEYYMAELYRKGMGFEYSRKGKPKVLYF